MSAEGVKAGRAYVELGLHDRLSSGLRTAKERLFAWSKGLTLLGTGTTGIATSILGPLLAAAQQFANVGGELTDLTAATGVSAEVLTALGYAAKQTGVDLNALHVGLRGLAKFTYQVASGGKGASQVLAKLGISAQNFLAASPEQRLALVADGLQTIQDPGLRAALAMKVLGKSGESLLPMLAAGSQGLQQFVDRARQLGLVITDEEAQKADALGDAWDDLLAVLRAIAFHTGAALADTLQSLLEVTIACAVAVSDFVRNNQGLILALAAVGVVTFGVSGLFFILAASAAALGLVMSGLNAIVTIAGVLWTALGFIKTTVSAINAWLTVTLTAEGFAALWAAVQTSLLAAAMTVLEVVTGAAAAMLAFLTTPLGILVVALAALTAGLALAVVWFVNFTTIGAAAVSILQELFLGLWQTAVQTIQGIFDAIIAGRWDLAAQIATAGLVVAWEQGVFALKSLWSQFKAWLIGLFVDLLAGVVQQLASFQSEIVSLINEVRTQLGLEPIEGFSFLDDWAQQAKADAELVKQGAALIRDAELSAARQRVTAAQAKLDQVTGEAKSARSEKAAQRQRQLKGLFDGLERSGQLNISAPGGTSLGTFSGAVAGLLGRSAPDDAGERTADASEAMEEHLDAIRRHVEEGGLAFE